MGRTQSCKLVDHLFQVGHTQNLFFDRSRWMHLSHLFFHLVLDTLAVFLTRQLVRALRKVINSR